LSSTISNSERGRDAPPNLVLVTLTLIKEVKMIEVSINDTGNIVVSDNSIFTILKEQG
jgi:hypothetical protein|tara:strand:+ start:494 stop:667 length:174 start_codon:yes stop_codon:yes gene_type:complete